MKNKHHFFIDYVDTEICILAKNLEAKNPEKDTFLFEVMSYPYKSEYSKDAFYTFDEALKLAQDECDKLNKKEQTMSERYIYIQAGNGSYDILDQEAPTMFSLIKIGLTETEAKAECDRLNRKEQENDRRRN